MDTLSLWQAVSTPSKKAEYPPLSEEIEVDVAIIGGGITGITAALHLVKAGAKVAILEAYEVGSGTTGNSTGNLYIETQPYYHNIAKKFNLDLAKTVAESRKMAIDEIEKNVTEKDIDCNFARRPFFLFTDKKDGLSILEKEVQTFKDMGFKIDASKDLPLPFKFKQAAIMENQARFNPLKYVQGLAAELKKDKCLIYENTRVDNITEKDVCLLTTSSGKVTARKVIVATHTPKGINHTQMFLGPYRSYVIGIRLPHNEYPEGHFWGIGEEQNISSTHAISSRNPEILLVAGSHHKTGQAKDALVHFEELEKYVKKQFPSYKIEYKWSAQHYQSADDVPYIGLASKSSKHTYIATGYFADGLTYGTIAGKVLSDLALNKEDKLTNVYNPNRSTLIASLGPAAAENFNVFLQYLKDLPWVSNKDYMKLKPGEGKVFEINSEKCAISKDSENKLHIVSAVCTHMKCIVKWNNAEQTWDCPCHGSRFSQDGKVLEGPAFQDLEKKNI